MSKQVIYEVPQGNYMPGYRLDGEVLEGVDGSKTLQLSSVVPAVAHPDPHKLVSVSLPPEGFAQLVKLLEPHTKP